MRWAYQVQCQSACIATGIWPGTWGDATWLQGSTVYFSRKCRLLFWYFWKYLLNKAKNHKFFEGEFLFGLWSTFLLQIFSRKCVCKLNISKIVRPILAGLHGVSQQGVWVPFWTPKPLKRAPQDTQIFQCGISKNLNLKLIIEFFHLLIIPMTLFNDIMPYFNEFIHVYGWNMNILWSSLKKFGRPKILQLPILGTLFLNPG